MTWIDPKDGSLYEPKFKVTPLNQECSTTCDLCGHSWTYTCETIDMVQEVMLQDCWVQIHQNNRVLQVCGNCVEEIYEKRGDMESGE